MKAVLAARRKEIDAVWVQRSEPAIQRLLASAGGEVLVRLYPDADASLPV